MTTGSAASKLAGSDQLTALEKNVERASEHLNPILVKEARQSLKSKQFLITFSLLLLSGWIWSLVGVALLSPGIYFAPGGRFMLGGYFLILVAPVLIVVPFSAFRSLAAEREDGTFELLSITRLGSRQIVTGKLGSAMLQMLVYYSALAPCVMFTYLLRGIDIFTILLLLVCTLMLSLLLSSIGLLLATTARARHWQVILSVLLLIGLLVATFIHCSIMTPFIVTGQRPSYETPEFWQGSLAVGMFHVSFVTLFILAAAGQLSFASDNRSTPVRVVTFVQQALWIGWLSFVWLVAEEDEVLFVFMTFAALYWFLGGALMSGEQGELSPRVRRSLPQSFSGRCFLTWFNPGSGTGYVFAVANLTGVAIVASALAVAGEVAGFGGAPRPADLAMFCGMVLAYVALYLGIGRLVVLTMSKLVRSGVFLAFLLQVLIALIGSAAPAFGQAWLEGFDRLAYSSLQATNWAWTLHLCAEGDIWAFPEVPLTIGVGALLVFVVNLCYSVRDVAQVRLEAPQRVLEDDSATASSRADSDAAKPPQADPSG